MKAARIHLVTVLALLSASAGTAQASENKAVRQPAYCAAEHLEVRQIALDGPGMMHSNVFLAVLNHGPHACTLRNGPVLVWSNNKTPNPPPSDAQESEEALSKAYSQQSDRDEPASQRYILPPVPADRKVALKDIFGFSVPNSDASGTGEWFTSLSVQLPNAEGRLLGRVYRSEYHGYASYPIPKTQFVLTPFLSWSIFEGDGCVRDDGSAPFVGEGATGSNIPAQTIDVRRILECG